MLQLIAQLQRYTIYTRFRAVWDSVFKEHCKTFVFFLLCFPPLFGKITSYLQRDNLQAPDVSLAI